MNGEIAKINIEEDKLQSAKVTMESEALAYLSLLPDVLCSSVSVSGQSGLDEYLCDTYNIVSHMEYNLIYTAIISNLCKQQ